MKTTPNKPATLPFGRRFLKLAAALTAVFLLSATAWAGPNQTWATTVGLAGGASITPSPRVLAFDTLGGSYAVGYGDSGPGTPGAAYITKLDSNGNFVWLTSLSSMGISSLAQFTDGKIVDNTGDLIVTGFVDEATAPSIWITVRIDSATGSPSGTWPDVGNGVGVRVISSPGVNLRGSRIAAVGLFAGGGALVSGASETELIMASYDTSGNFGIIGAYSPPGGVVDITAPVIMNRDLASPNEYHLAGTGISGSTGLDFIVAKFNAFGSLLWGAKYSPNHFGTDRLSDMAVDEDGHCFVTGESFDLNNNQIEMAVVRFNNGTGAIGWSARSGGAGGGRKVAIISGGATFVAGYGATNNTMSVWKYNTSGNLATTSWPAAGGNPAGVRRLGGTPGDQAEDVFLTAGKLYVTGKVSDGGIQKMTTWKLDASNGNTNWIERFGTFGNETSGVAVKGGGILSPDLLFGVGFTRSTSGGPDSLTVIRYAP
jgi:hypothetical protein